MSVFDGSWFARRSSSAAAARYDASAWGASPARASISPSRTCAERHPGAPAGHPPPPPGTAGSPLALLEQSLADRLHLRDISQVDVANFAKQAVGSVLGKPEIVQRTLGIGAGTLSLGFSAPALALNQHNTDGQADQRRHKQSGQTCGQRAVTPAKAQDANREWIAKHGDRFIDDPSADIFGKVFHSPVAVAPVMRHRLGAHRFERPRDGRLDLAPPLASSPPGSC